MPGPPALGSHPAAFWPTITVLITKKLALIKMAGSNCPTGKNMPGIFFSRIIMIRNRNSTMIAPA
jgi:hypothetical protein